MDNLIERYVYDVTRRLPEQERGEVGKELKSNIYDMLSDDADEAEIRTVLYELGAPAALAEKYRQKPRYLISPAYFEEYARVLKWVLPLVGVVVMAIGMIVGAFDAMKANAVGLADLFSGVLIKGLSMGISATFQALIWTTAGFVIAERAGARESGKAPEWKIEDLPEVQSDEKGKIPLSDSITELVVTVVFSILVILLCVGLVPYAFYFQNGDIQTGSVFSSTFLASCVPAVAIMALFGVAECVIKIQARRWTPLVCAAVVAHSLVGMGIVVYLLSRGDLFSVEFAAFLQSLDLGGPDWLHLVQVDGTNPLILLACTIVVVLSLVECGKAVYKTIKYK